MSTPLSVYSKTPNASGVDDESAKTNGSSPLPARFSRRWDWDASDANERRAEDNTQDDVRGEDATVTRDALTTSRGSFCTMPHFLAMLVGVGALALVGSTSSTVRGDRFLCGVCDFFSCLSSENEEVCAIIEIVNRRDDEDEMYNEFRYVSKLDPEKLRFYVHGTKTFEEHPLFSELVEKPSVAQDRTRKKGLLGSKGDNPSANSALAARSKKVSTTEMSEEERAEFEKNPFLVHPRYVADFTGKVHAVRFMHYLETLEKGIVSSEFAKWLTWNKPGFKGVGNWAYLVKDAVMTGSRKMWDGLEHVAPVFDRSKEIDAFFVKMMGTFFNEANLESGALYDVDAEQLAQKFDAAPVGGGEPVGKKPPRGPREMMYINIAELSDQAQLDVGPSMGGAKCDPALDDVATYQAGWDPLWSPRWISRIDKAWGNDAEMVMKTSNVVDISFDYERLAKFETAVAEQTTRYWQRTFAPPEARDPRKFSVYALSVDSFDAMQLRSGFSTQKDVVEGLVHENHMWRTRWRAHMLQCTHVYPRQLKTIEDKDLEKLEERGRNRFQACGEALRWRQSKEVTGNWFVFVRLPQKKLRALRADLQQRRSTLEKLRAASLARSMPFQIRKLAAKQARSNVQGTKDHNHTPSDEGGWTIHDDEEAALAEALFRKPALLAEGEGDFWVYMRGWFNPCGTNFCLPRCIYLGDTGLCCGGTTAFRGMNVIIVHLTSHIRTPMYYCEPRTLGFVLLGSLVALLALMISLRMGLAALARRRQQKRRMDETGGSTAVQRGDEAGDDATDNDGLASADSSKIADAAKAQENSESDEDYAGWGDDDAAVLSLHQEVTEAEGTHHTNTGWDGYYGTFDEPPPGHAGDEERLREVRDSTALALPSSSATEVFLYPADVEAHHAADVTGMGEQGRKRGFVNSSFCFYLHSDPRVEREDGVLLSAPGMGEEEESRQYDAASGREAADDDERRFAKLVDGPPSSAFDYPDPADMQKLHKAGRRFRERGQSTMMAAEARGSSRGIMMGRKNPLAPHVPSTGIFSSLVEKTKGAGHNKSGSVQLGGANSSSAGDNNSGARGRQRVAGGSSALGCARVASLDAARRLSASAALNSEVKAAAEVVATQNGSRGPSTEQAFGTGHRIPRSSLLLAGSSDGDSALLPPNADARRRRAADSRARSSGGDDVDEDSVLLAPGAGGSSFWNVVRNEERIVTDIFTARSVESGGAAELSDATAEQSAEKQDWGAGMLGPGQAQRW